MKTIKPNHLKKGDVVGVVASSLPVLPSFKENYERGKSVLVNKLGLQIKEGKTIHETKWWMAGTPREVAADINVMFGDPEIKAIIAQTGGYSAVSLLEHIDFDLVKKNPKPFVGFSNLTNFHLAFYNSFGMVGFHMGDLTFGLGNEDSAMSGFDTQMFEKFLMQTDKPGVIDPVTDWQEWRAGIARGKLIGGNLFNICNLIGTPYFPNLDDFDKAIFYWEEVGEKKVDIWARLYQLKYLGVFEKISGMLIGKVKAIKKMREEEIVEPTLVETVLEVCKDYDFPIMAGLDFGHFSVNIPMPVGVKVEFDTSKSYLNFLESGVS